MKKKNNKGLFITTIILLALSIFLAVKLYNFKHEIVLLKHTIFSKDKEIDELKNNNNYLKKQMTSLKEENELLLEKNNNIETSVSDIEPSSGLIKITNEILNSKVLNNETFILIITQDNCSHCTNYKPKLIKILEQYQLKAYEIDLNSLKLDSNLMRLFNVSGTPTTIFVKDGEESSVSNRLIGNVSEEKIMNRLKELNYIKK